MTKRPIQISVGVAAFSTLLILSFNPAVTGQGGGREPAKPKPSKAAIPAKRSTPPRKVPAAEEPTCQAHPPRETSGRTHALDLGNGESIEFVEIPQGSFCMGSTKGVDDEKPVHHVAINYWFYMGKYEVTQAQWQSVMGNNPSSFTDCGRDCPVEQVSWDDAQHFFRRLNRMDDGYTYRLPTESEWEYACRAGTTGDYAGNLNQIAWYGVNSGRRTHAVGSKNSNDWGLYDMHGNVLEWCEDWSHETYDGAPTDGTAWLSGGQQRNRALRGGSFAHDGSGGQLRASRRLGASPEGRSLVIGFRVVAVARSQ